jgi:hypothetical protein
VKVHELIDLLANEDPEAEVHIAYDYGDHWHTLVAPAVRRVEPAALAYSDYHRMPKVVDEGEDDDGGDMPVVLFSR